jgi:hypothetical protein
MLTARLRNYDGAAEVVAALAGRAQPYDSRGRDCGTHGHPHAAERLLIDPSPGDLMLDQLPAMPPREEGDRMWEGEERHRRDLRDLLLDGA